MRKSILALIVCALLCSIPASPQASPQQAKAAAGKHKVVFQLNSPAPAGWGQLFNIVANIQKSFHEDGVQVEVVFYGQGLPMLLKTNAAYAERLKEASEKGVILAACQNSMRARKVKSEDLFPFATEVDSGVAELVRKQEAGWSYIRGGE